MSVDHEFCDECLGCRPCLLDLGTGQPMPEDEEPMISILRIWNTQTSYAQRKAYIRVTVHNSRDKNDLNLAMAFVKKISDILQAHVKRKREN